MTTTNFLPRRHEGHEERTNFFFLRLRSLNNIFRLNVLLGALSAFVVQFLFPGFCFSQTVSSTAALVTPLSALGASARVDALGDAFVGLADDPSALFYNSAGLSQLKFASLSINHNSYLAGSFEETLLFGLPAGSLGGFAGALQYVSWGDLDERDANGVYQGTFTDSDVAFSAGWGMPLAKDFSLGVALHGIQQKVIDSLYTGLSGDMGLLWVPAFNFRLGLSYTGLGTAQAGFSPAQDLHLGLSSFLGLGSHSSLRPLLAGDWQPNGVSRFQGGLEGSIERVCFLRLGYQAALENNQIGGLTGFAAGAGFRVGEFQLDYAFVPYGDLGTSHRVSVGYEFPNPTPVVRPVTVIGSPVTVQALPVTVVATPQPIPVPAGPPKSKVEVRFELPTAAGTPMAEAQASTLVGPYEKAAQANPGSSQAWRNLGIIYLKTGETALGLQALEQALRLNPNDQALKEWLEIYKAKHPSNP
jgi:hypothetical protein